MSEPSFKICKCDGCQVVSGCKRFLRGWFCAKCCEGKGDIAELFKDLFKMEIKGG